MVFAPIQSSAQPVCRIVVFARGVEMDTVVLMKIVYSVRLTVDTAPTDAGIVYAELPRTVQIVQRIVDNVHRPAVILSVDQQNHA